MIPQLSIIIPVYNVEDYLERCVKSVINQDFRDIEVILVDDGSPDRCPQICDELAKIDNRIIVVHKLNGGLSAARNVGLLKAKGRFVAFLDSDDQWAEGQLKKIMTQITDTDADMIVFDGVDVYNDGSQLKRDYGDFFSCDFVIYEKLDYYKKIISLGDLRESACTKIFSRDFLLSNKLFYTEGLTGEDTEWMFRFLRVARKIAISNVILFMCTCGRMGSIQNTIRKKNILDLITTIDKSVVYCKEHPFCVTNQYELEHCAYLVANALGLLMHIKNKKEKYQLKKMLKSKSYLFNYSTNKKTKLVRIVYKILGYEGLVRFLECYMYLKKKNII